MALVEGRLRRPGGGRKRATETDPDLQAALEALIQPPAAIRSRPSLDVQEHALAGS